MATFNTRELDFGSAIVTLTSDISYTHVDVPAVPPLDPDPNALRDYVVIVKQGLTIDNLEKDLEYQQKYFK